MILHRLLSAGTIPFPKEIVVDFDALPTVIACHGKNGAGKSTFLELCVSCFYLTMPFRPGPLYKNFASRGYIDLTWSAVPGGPRFRSRLNIDPVAERVEASLFNAEGGSAIAGPLARDYLIEMRKRGIPPLDVFLSTAYTLQPSSTTAKNFFSFLLADRAERREIFAELLGLKPYQIREAVAKDKLKALDTQIVGNAGLIRALEQDIMKRPAAAERVQDTVARLEAAKTARDDLRSRLEGLRIAAADAKARVAAILPFRAQKDALTAEVGVLIAKQTAIEKTLVAARVDIAAATEVQEVPAEKEALIARRASLLPLKTQVDDLDKEISGLEIELLEIAENIKRNEYLLAEEDIILASVDRMTAVQAEIAALDAEIDREMATDSAALSAYQDWLSIRNDLAAKMAEEQRLQLQISTMDSVPCKGVDEFAGCKFLSQAAAAQSTLPGVHADVIALKEQVGELRTTPVAAAPPLKAKRATMLIDRDNLAPLVSKQVDLASARSRVDGLSDRKVRVSVTLDDKRVARDALTDQVTVLPVVNAALRAIEPKVILAATLGPARAVEAQAVLTLGEIGLTLADKRIAVDMVTAYLDGLTDAEAAVTQADTALSWSSIELQKAESTLGTIERELGSAQAELTRLEETAARLERLRVEMLPLQSDFEDWSLIARSQGPTGIPALRVDRAIPEIGERATELLRECLGETIFTILLTTQKQSADEKKLLETLDVIVLRNGKPMDAALLSGGEGVLVSEALSLSIALYNAERSGARSYTLFRDEVGAALDAARAPAFTRLLARAARIGGFDKILFVSHNKESVELADARLEFSNGIITVS